MGPKKGVSMSLFSLSTSFVIPDGPGTFFGLVLAITLEMRVLVIMGISKAEGG